MEVLSKVWDRITNEPVMTAAVVAILVLVGYNEAQATEVASDINTYIDAVEALVIAVTALIARSKVTPTKNL